MRDRCSAYDDFKQCRATKNITGVAIKIAPHPMNPILTKRVVIDLCPKHFMLPKE